MNDDHEIEEMEDIEQMMTFRDRVIEPQLISLRLQIRRLRRFIGRLRPLTPQEKFQKYCDGNAYSDQHYRDMRQSNHRQK